MVQTILKKSIAALTAIALISTNAIADNKTLDKNQENCQRVKGMSTVLVEMIAQTTKTSISSINFIRSEYSHPYGCRVVVDTPVGIKRCSFLWILQPVNGGRVFAGTMSGPGSVPCQ